MRTPEDPCRDPASEARDDHASEPRATPETDYAAWGETDVVEAAFARRLERQRDETRHQLDQWMKLATSAEILRKKTERQRDELLEALELLLQHRPRADWEGLTIAETLAWDNAEDAIAAVKGGNV